MQPGRKHMEKAVMRLENGMEVFGIWGIREGLPEENAAVIRLQLQWILATEIWI